MGHEGKGHLVSEQERGCLGVRKENKRRNKTTAVANKAVCISGSSISLQKSHTYWFLPCVRGGRVL